MSIREILAKHGQERITQRLTRSQNPKVADVIENNICTIIELRTSEERQKTLQDKVADRITAFSGSMWFIYLHVVWFASWMLINAGVTPLPKFNPYPYTFLTMVLSL